MVESGRQESLEEALLCIACQRSLLHTEGSIARLQGSCAVDESRNDTGAKTVTLLWRKMSKTDLRGR